MSAHLKLIKNLFSNVLGTPKGHPKSKPFIDRCEVNGDLMKIGVRVLCTHINIGDGFLFSNLLTHFDLCLLGFLKRIMSFYAVDNCIWVRNYQIIHPKDKKVRV